jgi:hypothetical protein
MDSTKAVMCDIRHRALRHHWEGIQNYISRNGQTSFYGHAEYQNEPILIRHLEEDVDIQNTPQKTIPHALDWVREITNKPVEWLRIPVPAPGDVARISADRFGGKSEDWLPFHAWMLEDFGISAIHGDNRHLLFRHHAFGCFDAEQEWGHMYNGIPTRILAEKHIMTLFRRVPSASEMLRIICIQRWMSPSPQKVSEIKGLFKVL